MNGILQQLLHGNYNGLPTWMALHTKPAGAHMAFFTAAPLATTMVALELACSPRPQSFRELKA